MLCRLHLHIHLHLHLHLHHLHLHLAPILPLPQNFWKDNHKAFEAENCAAIKTLVALLVPESDAQTLAVACHDIGEFVKHHPEGRRLMTQFGAKLAVMAILKHSDPEVQKHALTAVQRLMVINWDLLAVGK